LTRTLALAAVPALALAPPVLSRRVKSHTEQQKKESHSALFFYYILVDTAEEFLSEKKPGMSVPQGLAKGAKSGDSRLHGSV
jgi:hypothetical protein